jgi:hypothetical protein
MAASGVTVRLAIVCQPVVGDASPDPDRVLPPEAATPGRATLGETGQEPREDLAHKPIPAAQPTDILPIAAIPGPAEPRTMASTG